MAEIEKETASTAYEGFCWGLISIIAGGAAMVCSNHKLKFLAALTATIAGTTAVKYYKDSAETTYKQAITEGKDFDLPFIG
jgi:hypothetical protein